VDIKLDNPSEFSVTDNQGVTQVALPSAGVSLFFNQEESLTLKAEASRFLRETVSHSHYALKRFNIQYKYIKSHIMTLIHRKQWDQNGFTESGLNHKGDEFCFDVSNLIEFMAVPFCFGKQLNEFMEDLPIKVNSDDVLEKWPSVAAMKDMPHFEKAEYKGDWTSPFLFSSSSTLAGMVKPVIFYDGKVDISINGGKVKIYVGADDALPLFTLLFDDDELEKFNIAKQAWSALDSLQDGLRRFINDLKENGYDDDLQYFDDEKLNINGVHEALLKLDKGIASETEMLALNQKYKKVESGE
jgi:hypothetical protein